MNMEFLVTISNFLNQIYLNLAISLLAIHSSFKDLFSAIYSNNNQGAYALIYSLKIII